MCNLNFIEDNTLEPRYRKKKKKTISHSYMMTCLHKWCIIFVKGGKFERSFFRINIEITESLKITLLPNHFNNKCNLENSI